MPSVKSTDEKNPLRSAQLRSLRTGEGGGRSQSSPEEARWATRPGDAGAAARRLDRQALAAWMSHRVRRQRRCLSRGSDEAVCGRSSSRRGKDGGASDS
ncbi:hypothetical protein M6B38_217965 [Iris pallida]|uniref:Uncharacterized protein n=1 Tax=Iris pallida TaxID=29817 RepID=A0AAX6E0L4_IRIPA|nr:hypothetical protein M6B38_217965 [Iris pallida]